MASPDWSNISENNAFVCWQVIKKEFIYFFFFKKALQNIIFFFHTIQWQYLEIVNVHRGNSGNIAYILMTNCSGNYTTLTAIYEKLHISKIKLEQLHFFL